MVRDGDVIPVEVIGNAFVGIEFRQCGVIDRPQFTMHLKPVLLIKDQSGVPRNVIEAVDRDGVSGANIFLIRQKVITLLTQFERAVNK